MPLGVSLLNQTRVSPPRNCVKLTKVSENESEACFKRAFLKATRKYDCAQELYSAKISWGRTWETSEYNLIHGSKSDFLRHTSHN